MLSEIFKKRAIRNLFQVIINHQKKSIDSLEDSKNRDIDGELNYILNFIKTLSNIINEFQQREIQKKVRINIRSQSATNNNTKLPIRDTKRIKSSINSRFESLSSK